VSYFIGIDTIDVPDEFVNSKVNVTKAPPQSPFIARSINYVMTYVRRNTYAEGALSLARRTGVLDTIVRLNHRQRVLPPMSNSKFDELASFYEDEVRQLGNFVGKDLSWWLKKPERM
jgi:hypothetical protein